MQSKPSVRSWPLLFCAVVAETNPEHSTAPSLSSSCWLTASGPGLAADSVPPLLLLQLVSYPSQASGTASFTSSE